MNNGIDAERQRLRMEASAIMAYLDQSDEVPLNPNRVAQNPTTTKQQRRNTSRSHEALYEDSHSPSHSNFRARPQRNTHPRPILSHTSTQSHRQRQQYQQQRKHATVEKRYRNGINSKIQKLSHLIPASNTFNPADPHHESAENNDAIEGAQKVPTKSVVLDKAIQYINHLVATHEQYETEQQELKRRLEIWLEDDASRESPARQEGNTETG